MMCGCWTLLMAALATQAAPAKPEFAELENLLKQIVVAQLPKVHEDRSKWGGTIPVPDKKIAFKKLRKKIETERGNELPHGTWKRSKLWVDDPNRDVKITVYEFRSVDGKKSMLRVGALIAAHGEIEQQNWSRGIRLLDLIVRADSKVAIVLECDVATMLKANGIWPELALEPTVKSCKIDLVDFRLKRVGVIEGKMAEQLGQELEEVLKRLVRRYEPKIVEKANAAIAKSLRDGKNSIGLASLGKLFGGAKAPALIGAAVPRAATPATKNANQ